MLAMTFVLHFFFIKMVIQFSTTMNSSKLAKVRKVITTAQPESITEYL